MSFVNGPQFPDVRRVRVPHGSLTTLAARTSHCAGAASRSADLSSSRAPALPQGGVQTRLLAVERRIR